MMCTALRLGSAAITIAVTAAGGAARAQNPTALPLRSEKLDTSTATLSPDATGNGIRVSYRKTDWPSVQFRTSKAYASPDMSDQGGIAFEVHNPNTVPLQLFIRVDDSPEADGTHHCRTGNATLAPDETATLVFPLDTDVKGMRAGPPLVSRAAKPRQLTIYGDPLNTKNIVAFEVFLSQPKEAYNLDLRSVRLLPKPDLTGIVDRWGQYAKDDWPGKIKSDADLTRSAGEETAWLKANPPLADRDEYGGWQSGPTLRGTGFFRTALVASGKEIAPPKQGTALPANARWWLVTPSGHLFWSAGVDCVRPYAETPVAGRETFFSVFPAVNRQSGTVDFYHDNLSRKGIAEPPKWMDLTVARFKSWGFNTAGNWSDGEVFRAHRVPYTVPLGVYGLPTIGKGTLPDFFDASFPERIQTNCKEGTAATKDDPWCLGYFVDNELAWDTWAQMGTGGEYVVARDALAAPAAQPARRAFVALLQKQYATPAAWGNAWGVTITDWDTPVTLSADKLNAKAKTDCAAFSTLLAERYFSVVRDAVKAAAPKQLYLGCRFAIRPVEIVSVAARYCDVVSFNIYEDQVLPATWNFTKQLGKPVLIGEYHFGATDRGMFHAGLRERASQAERAKAFAEYVTSARAQPAFVGCHWFQWIDEPLVGRFDGENYNIGFITVTDTPYPEMRDAARRVHATLYK